MKTKHNIFEENAKTVDNQITNDELNTIVHDFMTGDGKDGTSLNDTFLAHGITNIETLFPEPTRVGDIQEVDVKDEWCQIVVNGVKHYPKEKTRSDHFDITGDEARALGYIKGNLKKEEQIAVMKRSTEATMVYKKQALDKDDEIEMDYDLLGYYRKEMRKKLIQENARAILVGDGRPDLVNDDVNPDKIKEDRIRPIWKDNEFYCVHHTVSGVTSASTMAQRTAAVIDACIRAQDDYQGSGSPTLFINPKYITEALLLKNSLGERIYKNIEDIKAAMDVSKIVKVDLLKNNFRRTEGSGSKELVAILVNLNDYCVGTNGKGQTKFYDQFDIHYNRTYLLIENRFSGALLKYHSAVAIELDVASGDIEPTMTISPIAGTETKYGKTVSSLQSGVRVTDVNIVGNLKYVTGYTGYSGEVSEQSGYYIALHCDCNNSATTTVELVGSGRPAGTFTSEDKDVVCRITDPKKEYLKFTSTVSGGRTITKKFTLNGLNLVEA